MLEERIARVRYLIAARDEINAELVQLLGVTAEAPRNRRCKKCGQEGHRADHCPNEKAAPEGAAVST